MRYMSGWDRESMGGAAPLTPDQMAAMAAASAGRAAAAASAAAGKAGQEAEKASAAAMAAASEAAAVRHDPNYRPPNPAGPLLLLAAVGVGAYLLLRRD